MLRPARPQRNGFAVGDAGVVEIVSIRSEAQFMAGASTVLRGLGINWKFAAGRCRSIRSLILFRDRADAARHATALRRSSSRTQHADRRDYRDPILHTGPHNQQLVPTVAALVTGSQITAVILCLLPANDAQEARMKRR